VHEASQTSRGLFRLHHDLAYCYEAFSKDPQLSTLEPELRCKASEYHSSIAVTYLRASKSKQAREHFDRAIALSYNRRSLLGWLLARMPSSWSQRILRWRGSIVNTGPEMASDDLSSLEIVRSVSKPRESGAVKSCL